MTNAEKFQEVFGIYATEMWAMPEQDFLKWLNADTPQTEKPNIWKRIDKPFRAVWLDDDHNEIGTPQTDYKKWEAPPKFEHKGIITTCVSVPVCLLEDKSQTSSTPYKIETSSICKNKSQVNCPKTCPSIDICTKDDTDCVWKKG